MSIKKFRQFLKVDKAQADLSNEFLKLIGSKKLYPPLNGYSAFIQGSEYNIQKYYGRWYNNEVHLDLFILMKNGFSQVWFSETDIKLSSEYALKEFIISPKKFNERLKLFYRNVDKVDKLYERYSYKKIETYSWNKLVKLVNEIRDLIWDANAAISFSFYLDKKLCWEILDSAGYELSKEALEKMWPHAIKPAFASFYKYQLEYFLNLVKKRVEISKISEKCQYFLTDYFSAKDLDVVKNMLEKNFFEFLHKNKSATVAIQKENKKLKIIIKEYKKWFSHLSDKEKMIANYLQLVMKIRDRRKNFFAKGLTIIYRIAEKLFSDVGVPLDLIPFYTIRELIYGAKYLKAHVDILSARKNGFQLLIPYRNSVEMLESSIDQAVAKINNFFMSSYVTQDNIDVLKGQTGVKGNIRGKVHIILDANSNHEFQKGEILVTGLTRPEYIPLMKKAVGIITDEGGITCHAAIVSRELGLPCIVGTKIATKVLKDGDLVEINADKGIVKILKNEKNNL